MIKRKSLLIMIQQTLSLFKKIKKVVAFRLKIGYYISNGIQMYACGAQVVDFIK
jgi:hypothetical protein